MARNKIVMYLDNERELLDAIINYNQNRWDEHPSYVTLKNHIKNKGGIKDVDYFFANIEKIAGYRGGIGLNLIYYYCRNVSRKRFSLDVEKRLFSLFWKNHRTSVLGYKYARYVVRGKLPEDCEVGCKSLRYVAFLRKKGLEYENVLMGSTYLSYYFYKYYYFLPDNAHNFMLGNELMGDAYAKGYFKNRKRDDNILRNRLSVVDENKSIKEFLSSL